MIEGGPCKKRFCSRSAGRRWSGCAGWPRGCRPRVYVKVESLNPGGSVKDRVGLAMIAEAERRGWLRPGGTIIEATAGNTGVGLAMVAAVKGYRCIFVLPDKMSSEKIALLKAYGAEVVITPTSVAPDSPDSYNGVADRLAREIPGAWRPNQFTNLANPEIHYRTTGHEIWEQTEGRITAFVAGVGTGGTISGVARYLKEQNPEVRIIGADPEGSVLSGDSPGPGRSRASARISCPRRSTARWWTNGSASAMPSRSTRPGPWRGAKGILVGGSSGTAVAAALRYARRLTGDHLVVALCARHRPQLPEQVLRRRLAGGQQPGARTCSRPTPSATCSASAGSRQLVTITPEATVAEAIGLMQATGISQLPVLARRQAGRQHPGSDAGPRAARPRRSRPRDGRRDHGPAAAAAGRHRAPGRGVSPAAGRQHRRAGGGGRQGGRTSSRASTWCRLLAAWHET